MPSIKIFEEDLTRGGGRATNLNVVYVPGFMSTSTDVKDGVWPKVASKDEDGKDLRDESGKIIYECDYSDAALANVPMLCETVSQFEMYFGNSPAVLTDNTVDKSYLYAKELLASGLPVLYESMNRVGDGINPSKEYMYDCLLTAYDKLYDRGQYQFKYLTSGGYANFGVTYKYTDVTETTVLNTTESESLGEAMLLNDYTVEQEMTLEYAGLNDRGSHQWTYTNGKTTTFTESVEGTSFTLYTNEKDENGKITITPVIRFTLPENTNEKEYVRQSNRDFTTALIFTVPQAGKLNVAWKGTNSTTTTSTEKEETNSNIIATKMAALTVSDSREGESRSRGDCIALIDHIDNPEMDMTGENSIYREVADYAKYLNGAENSAMFTPWVNVILTTYTPPKEEEDYVSMPPSFAYLMAFAKSIRTNASWLAIAGATRGQIPNLSGKMPLNLNKTLTNSIAESYQNRDGVSINAITNIKPFGYRIWGNRTLKDNSVEGNLTATSFLNTKNMVCDVKKVVWDACRKYMFEQNNDVLWLNFKSYIEPTLDNMKSGAGLSGYKIIRGTTTEKAKLVAIIKLYPLYAVEDFEVTVQMLDDEIAVS